MKRDLQKRYGDWTITKTSGGHFKMTHPKIAKPVFTSATPSDWRARRNLNAMIKRLTATIVDPH